MTASEDADTFEVLAAQLETEGSLMDADPSPGELPDLDPTLVPADVRAALEAILIVASDPVAPTVLAQLLEVSVETIEALCEYLADSYAQEERGFTITRVAGGFRYQTADAQAPSIDDGRHFGGDSCRLHWHLGAGIRLSSECDRSHDDGTTRP